MMRPILAIILVAGALANPARRGEQRCSTECTQSERLTYRTGRVYTYDYEAENILDFQNLGVGMHIKAAVKVEALAPCEMSLTFERVNFKESKDGDKTNSPANQQFKRSLEAHPLRFSFQDGKVREICPTDEEDREPLNVKRAFLSAFQNSVDGLKRDGKVLERDVSGECETVYKLTSNGNEQTVHKKKDLSSCARRSKNHMESQPKTYFSDSKQQSIPLLRGEQMCTQQLMSSRLQLAECEEEHTYRPISGQAGATVRTRQKLQLSTESAAAASATHNTINRRLPLTFDHGVEQHIDNDMAEAVRALKDLNDDYKVRKEIKADTPDLFLKLVSKMRTLHKNKIKQLMQHTQAQSESAKNFLQDALPVVGTRGSVAMMVKLIKDGDVLERRENVFLMSIAMMSHPNEEALQEAAKLLNLSPPKGLLAVSSLVRNLCSTQTCTDMSSVSGVITKLTALLGENCAFTDEDQHYQIMLALKALGNVGEFSSEVSGVLMRCFTTSAETDVRVAALEAYRQTPCHLQQQQRPDLMEHLRDMSADSEVRIAAYLALMRCPTEALITEIKNILEIEKVNQVGSFMWTHLTNLAETASPLRQGARKLISSAKLSKKFDVDKRKFSRNIEKSVFVNYLNMGGSVESDVIFSQKSFVPRSLRVNLTLDMFGSSFNLLDAGLRVQGLEPILQELAGRKRDKDSIPTSPGVARAILNDMSRQFNAEEDPFRAAMSLRILGNELMYNEMNEIPDTSIDYMGWARKLASGVRSQVILTRSLMIMSNRLSFPTASGLAIDLDLEATASMSLKYKGKMDMRRMLSWPPRVDIDGRIDPSAAVMIRGTISSGAFGAQAGGRMDIKLHTATSIGGKLELRPREKAQLRIDMPRAKQEILSIKTERFALHRGEATVIPAQTPQSTHKACSLNRLKQVFGAQACFEVSYPSSGEFMWQPVKASIYLQKTDRHTAYNIEAVVETGEEKSILLMMDMPGTSRDRLISLDGKLSPSEFSINLESPWKRFTVKGDYNNQARNSNANAVVEIDGVEQLRVAGTLNDQGNNRKTQYALTLEGRAEGSEPQKVTGLFVHIPNTKLKGELKLENILQQTLEADVLMTADEGSYSLVSNVKSQVGDFGYTGSLNTGEINSFTNKLLYKLPGEEQKQLALSGKFQDYSTDSLTKFSAESQFRFDEYPMTNFAISLRHEYAENHMDSSLETSWGANSEPVVFKHRYIYLPGMTRARFEHNVTLNIPDIVDLKSDIMYKRTEREIIGNMLAKINRNSIDGRTFIKFKENGFDSEGAVRLKLGNRVNRARGQLNYRRNGLRHIFDGKVRVSPYTPITFEGELTIGRRSGEGHLRITKDLVDYVTVNANFESEESVKGTVNLVVAVPDANKIELQLSGDVSSVSSWQAKADLLWDADNDRQKRAVVEIINRIDDGQKVIDSGIKGSIMQSKFGGSIVIERGSQKRFNITALVNEMEAFIGGRYALSADHIGASVKLKTPYIEGKQHLVELTLEGKKDNEDKYSGDIVVDLNDKRTDIHFGIQPREVWKHTGFEIDLGIPDVATSSQNRFKLAGTVTMRDLYEMGINLNVHTPAPEGMFDHLQLDLGYALKMKKLMFRGAVMHGTNKKVGFNILATRPSEDSWNTGEGALEIFVPKRDMIKAETEYHLTADDFKASVICHLDSETEVKSTATVEFWGTRYAAQLVIDETGVTSLGKLETECSLALGDDNSATLKFNGLQYNIETSGNAVVKGATEFDVDASVSLQGISLDIVGSAGLAFSTTRGNFKLSVTKDGVTRELSADYDMDERRVAFSFDHGNDPYSFDARVLNYSHNEELTYINAIIEGSHSSASMKVTLDGSYEGLKKFGAELESNIPEDFFDFGAFAIPKIEGKVNLQHELTDEAYNGEATVEHEQKKIGLVVRGSMVGPFTGYVLLTLPDREFLFDAVFTILEENIFEAKVELNAPFSTAFFVHNVRLESKVSLSTTNPNGYVRLYDNDVDKLGLDVNLKIVDPYEVKIRFYSPWHPAKRVKIEATASGSNEQFEGTVLVDIIPLLDGEISATFVHEYTGDLKTRVDVNTPFEGYYEVYAEVTHERVVGEPRYKSKAEIGGFYIGGTLRGTIKIESDLTFNSWHDMKIDLRIKLPMIRSAILNFDFKGDEQFKVITANLLATLEDKFYDFNLEVDRTNDFKSKLSIFNHNHPRSSGNPEYTLIVEGGGSEGTYNALLHFLRIADPDLLFSIDYNPDNKPELKVRLQLPVFEPDSIFYPLRDVEYTREQEVIGSFQWMFTDKLMFGEHEVILSYSLIAPSLSSIEADVLLKLNGNVHSTFTFEHKGTPTNFNSALSLVFNSQDLFSGNLTFNVKSIFETTFKLHLQAVGHPANFEFITDLTGAKCEVDLVAHVLRFRYTVSVELDLQNKAGKLLITTPHHHYRRWKLETSLPSLSTFESAIEVDEHFFIRLNGRLNDNKVISGRGSYLIKGQRNGFRFNLSLRKRGRVRTNMFLSMLARVTLDSNERYQFVLNYSNIRRDEKLVVDVRTPHDAFHNATLAFQLKYTNLLTYNGLQAVQYNGKQIGAKWSIDFTNILQGKIQSDVFTPFEGFETNSFKYRMADGAVTYEIHLQIGDDFILYRSQCHGELTDMKCRDKLITPFLKDINVKTNLKRDNIARTTSFKTEFDYDGDVVTFGFDIKEMNSYAIFLLTPSELFRSLKLSVFHENGDRMKLGGMFNLNDFYIVNASSAVQWLGEFRSNKVIYVSADVDTSFSTFGHVVIENQYEDTENSAELIFKLDRNDHVLANEKLTFEQDPARKEYEIKYKSHPYLVSAEGKVKLGKKGRFVVEYDTHRAEASGSYNSRNENVKGILVYNGVTDSSMDIDWTFGDTEMTFISGLQLDEGQVYRKTIDWKQITGRTYKELYTYDLLSPNTRYDGQLEYRERSGAVEIDTKFRPNGEVDYWTVQASSIKQRAARRSELKINNKWSWAVTNPIHNGMESFLNGQFVFENTEDSNTKLTGNYGVRQQSTSPQLSAELDLANPSTNLLLSLGEYLSYTEDEWALTSTGKYKTVSGALKEWKYELSSNTNNGKFRLKADDPLHKFVVNGQLLRSANGIDASLLGSLDDSSPIGVSLSANNRVESFDLKLNYDPEDSDHVLHTYGHVVNGTTVVVETYHVSSGERNTDLRVLLSMIKPYLLRTEIDWEPSILRQLTRRWERLKSRRSQQISALLFEYYEAMSTEAVARLNEIQETYREPLAAITVRVNMWKQALASELRTVYDTVKKMYRNDIFFIKSVIDWVSREMVTPGEEMISESAAQVEQWMTEAFQRLSDAIETAYDKLIERLNNLKLSELIDSFKSNLEGLRQQYIEAVEYLVNFLNQQVNEVLSVQEQNSINEFLSNINSDTLNALGNWVSSSYERVGHEVRQLQQQLEEGLREQVGLEALIDRAKETQIEQWNTNTGVIRMNIFLPLGISEETEKSLDTSLLDVLNQLGFHWDLFSYQPLAGGLLPPYEAMGVLSGDQNFVTFDGQTHSFRSTCSLLLAHDFLGNEFTAVVSFNENGRESVTVFSGTDAVELKRDGTVLVGGSEQQLPWQGERIRVYSEAGRTELVLRDNDLQVSCDVRVCTVTVSGWYHGRTAGLLGLFNNEPHDDLINSQRQPTEDLSAWQVSRSCEGGNEARNNPHTSNVCAQTFGDHSALSSCYNIVNSTDFLQMCSNDVNEPTSDTCTSVAAYVSLCRFKGIDIHMPNSCLKCSEDMNVADEDSRTENFAGTDVVFVIDLNEKNRRVVPRIKSMVNRIKVARQREPTHFGVIAYGGQGVFSEPRFVRASLLSDDVDVFENTVSGLNFNGNDDISADPVAAVSLAARTPYRPWTHRHVVLVASQACTTSSSGVGESDLTDNNIMFHYLRPVEFEHELNYTPLGFDSSAIFSARTRTNPPDTEQYDQVSKPESDVCYDLAVGSRGTIWDSTSIVSRPVQPANVFSKVAAKILGQAEFDQDCMTCVCVADGWSGSRSECKSCPERTFLSRLYDPALLDEIMPLGF